MDSIVAELKRIYTFDAPRWSDEWLSDFSEEERATWDRLPSELKAIAEFIGREDTLPHERVRMLYGPFELVEWNCADGTFGQLRDTVEGYAYPDVVKFGDDAYFDATGQLGPAGGVYAAVGHDLDGAQKIADDLPAFLRAAGSYRSG